ncbi:MAG: hypothetical protein HWN65_24415, partial [Candidatus Helarchaeota archaeon]|nr:hypothetical protein [Candidatus Helarchaeota archaeon]
VPLLASDIGSWDATFTQYTIPLRSGITFHDNSTFNADDVVFTFDRMEWLYNFTGLNPGYYLPYPIELYVFPNGTPIIKDVVKNSDYSVTFNLNDKYAPFEDLLCYPASSILTDTYYNITGGIVEIDDDVMGTGPFVFDHYQLGVELTMHAYANYWQGKAQIDELKFVEIRNDDSRNNALLTGSIDFLKDPLPKMLEAFYTEPDINVLNQGRISP